MTPGEPIKLFVDAHVFDKEFQGTRTFIREIYSRLAARAGLELFLAAYDTDQLRQSFPAADNIRFLSYGTRSSVRRLAWDIPRLLRKNKVDYAHFQYICPPVKVCRYIVTVHDVIFSEYPAEFPLTYRMGKKVLFKRSAQMADILTTVSAYSEKSIRRYLCIDPRVPVHIVPNGVAEKFFEPYNRQAAKKRIAGKFGFDRYILYVSRFEPRKNHNFLLKAWLDLRLYEQGYYLVLLGHRSIRIPDFDETIRNLPGRILQYIFLADRVDDTDLMDFYRGAEVFVYPSKGEGFGIPPLEAAALKIPVICSNSSAMAQFSFFGQYHIDPTDINSLKNKLSSILTNPPAADTLEAIARQIREQFSWEYAADQLWNAINLPKIQ